MTVAPGAATAESGRLSGEALKLTLICALIYLLDGLIHSLPGPLAPDFSRELALDTGQLGPIFSANLIGQCVGLVLLPILASRIGHRRVVVATVAGFGVAQCASAFAGDATDMFVWRLVTGVFLGGCLPSCLAMVSTAVPAARRGVGIMTLFAGYGLGATLAGLVAAAFAGLGGWRAAMGAAGLASLLVAFIAWRGLHERASSPTEPAGQPAPSRGPLALQILAPRYRLGTLMLWLLFIAMLTISYCLNSWLPVLLVEVGRGERFAALSVSVFSFGGIIAALGVGLVIDRVGATRTLLTCMVISTLMLFAIGRVLATASGTSLMVMLAVCGFFVLGAYGGINVILAGFYPEALRATGIGWAKSVGRVGTILAPVLIGLGLQAGLRETAVMSGFAVPASVAALALLVLAYAGRRRSA